MMMEKQIERFLIVVLALTIISIIGSFSSSVLISRLYGPKYVGLITMHTKLVSIILQIFGALVYLAVGIWLYSLAHQDKSRPWLWLVFGFAFGLIAVILFYLIRIYDILKSESRREEKT